MLNVSIIIPTLNESRKIESLLQFLFEQAGEFEVIIVDGGSTDDTLDKANTYPLQVIETTASRAKQLNLGAAKAQFEQLYFLHADTIPPDGFIKDLKESIDLGFSAATYRSSYEKKGVLMALNSFFTRFPWLITRGGDQSLLISKTMFNELGGFDEKMEIMEEYPIISQLLKAKQLRIIPKYIQISSRKYENNSWWAVQRANYKAFKLYRKGASSNMIKTTYKKMLN